MSCFAGLSMWSSFQGSLCTSLHQGLQERTSSQDPWLNSCYWPLPSLPTLPEDLLSTSAHTKQALSPCHSASHAMLTRALTAQLPCFQFRSSWWYLQTCPAIRAQDWPPGQTAIRRGSTEMTCRSPPARTGEAFSYCPCPCPACRCCWWCRSLVSDRPRHGAAASPCWPFAGGRAPPDHHHRCRRRRCACCHRRSDRHSDNRHRPRHLS